MRQARRHSNSPNPALRQVTQLRVQVHFKKGAAVDQTLLNPTPKSLERKIQLRSRAPRSTQPPANPPIQLLFHHLGQQ